MSGASGVGAALPRVVVHWRPGCGFCARLFRALESSPIAFERVDIWEDPEAAAWVRSVADGNEVVPTVRVGDEALVNPGLDDIVAAIARQA